MNLFHFCLCFCVLFVDACALGVCVCVLFVLYVFLYFVHVQQVSSESKLMKRSFSTFGDQCVNGDWQEEFSLERVSPDRLERPRQRSFRGQFEIGMSKALVLWYQVKTNIEKHNS